MKLQTKSTIICILTLLLAINCTVGWSQTNDPSVRIWTDNTGKHKIQAEFMRVENDSVVLKKPDGTTLNVPLKRLSQKDQEFLTLLQSKKEAPGPSKKKSDNTKKDGDIKISATISKNEPLGVVFFDAETQQPIFVTLRIEGKSIVDAINYGKFKFDSITDDKGKTLELLQPIVGSFNQDLAKKMVELDHFFLESPGVLQLHLVVGKPSTDAKTISVNGSFQLDVRSTITIDNVLSQLNKPLAAAGLEKVGTFTASLPKRGESVVAGSLAVDFVGDRKKVDDIELLRGDGLKISTGGTGEGSNRKARIIRWAGEELPKDTKLRIILAEKPKRIRVPIELNDAPIYPPRNVVTGGSADSPQNKSAARPPSPSKQSGDTKPGPVVKATIAPKQVAIEFFRAAQQGELATVKKLLAQYPSLNHRKDPRRKETAFSKACWNGRTEIVAYLIEQGADVNARAGDKVTPLHQAARKGQLEVVQLLLKHGADPTLKNDQGVTASEMATKNAHSDVLKAIQQRVIKNLESPELQKLQIPGTAEFEVRWGEDYKWTVELAELTPGKLTATVTWNTGTQPLALMINHSETKNAVIRQDGKSPLAIQLDFDQADLDRGGTWTISVAQFNNKSAVRGTIGVEMMPATDGE